MLGCLKVGLKWSLWCEANSASAAILPVPLLTATCLWLLLDRGMQHLWGAQPIREFRLCVQSIIVGLAAYGLFVQLGSSGALGRWVVVTLWLLTCSTTCLLASRALRDVEFSSLVTRRWKLRILAGTLGFFCCILMIIASEVTCGYLMARRPAAPAKLYEGDYLAPGIFFREDPELGVTLQPGRRVSCQLTIGDRSLWDVHYSTDEYGRRRTLFPGTKTPEATIVFFGCSFLFGEGSEDSETIPSQFCRLAPGYMATNYGVPGWGTQQMLTLLESRRLASQMYSPANTGVYLYLPEIHESRVVGEMDIVNSFGRDFPCYELDSEGLLQRHGSFSSGRPLTTFAYGVMGKSRTRAFLGLNFPRRSPEHYTLTAAIIDRSRELFLEQFPGSRFLVVVYPGHAAATPTVELCRNAGIEILDLQGLFDPSASEMQYFGDGHPTPLANRTVAKAIADFLAQP